MKKKDIFQTLCPFLIVLKRLKVHTSTKREKLHEIRTPKV